MHHHARQRLIERARAYLRRNDFVFGYFPQLAMEQKASEWWSLLWYCVRNLDTRIDASETPMDTECSMDEIVRNLDDSDFRTAFSLFLQETGEVVPRSLIHDLYRSTQIETARFGVAQPPTAASYLQLVDMKAVIPVRIALLLNRATGEPERMARFATGLGRTVQLLDDLLDLREDLEQGRLFITQEELDILGLAPSEIPANFGRVTELRTKWILATIGPAYAALSMLPENNFCLAARGWFEATLRLISDGKAEPLQRSILKSNLFFAHYMGASTLPFDLCPGSELLKYRLLHRPAVVFLKRYKVFEEREARELYLRAETGLGPLRQYAMAPGPDNSLPSDLRTFVDLNESFGLLGLQTNMQSIAIETAFDWYSEAARRADNDPARAIRDLIGDAADFVEAVRFREPPPDGSPPPFTEARRAGGFGQAVNFGSDSFSIFVQHQVALQNELRAWGEAALSRGQGGE